MNKTTLAALLGLSSLVAMPAAFAQDRNNGFFIEARGGSASVDEDDFDDTTTAFQIGGGYRWGGFGIEGGYVTFNDFEDNSQGLDINAEVDGFTLGVNGRTNFAEDWYLSGRIGAFFWDAEADTAVLVGTTPTRIEADDDGTDFYAGVGMGYDFSEQVSLGVAYDYFGPETDASDLGTNVFSVTGEVRF
jgi:OOP family OmpA-OmpF porin/outer membrane immunogenic protein